MKVRKYTYSEIVNSDMIAVPANAAVGDDNFLFGFTQEKLCGNGRAYGTFNEAGYHMLLSGDVNLAWSDGRSFQMNIGDAGYCDHGMSVQSEGEGTLLHMILGNYAWGRMKMTEIKKNVKKILGETVGENYQVIMALKGDVKIGGDGLEEEIKEGEVLEISLAQGECINTILSPVTEGAKIISAGVTKTCFIPFHRKIGTQIIEQRVERCKVKLPITDLHMNPIHSIHGGVLFTIADLSGGICAAADGGICSTLSSTIHYLNAALEPEYIIATAYPVKRGKQVRTMHVDIHDEREVVLCSVEVSYFNLQKM